VRKEQTGLTFQIRAQDGDEQDAAAGLESTLYPLYDEVVFNRAMQQTSGVFRHACFSGVASLLAGH